VLNILITTFSAPGPDCLEGGSYAYLTLPGDTKLVEAWMPDRSKGLPPICDRVAVSPWSCVNE